MTEIPRRRRLAAATLVATLVLGVLLFVSLSHGLLHHPMDDGHGGGSGDGVVALCLVLFTVLAPLALAAPAPQRWAVPKLVAVGVLLGASPASSSPPAQARASPSWLQRFRN